MMVPLAAAVHAGRRFGDVVAVDGVTLDVRAGEVVGLLGANGAGKTTLVRMLLGLVRPTSGEVLLFGFPPSREARRRLGYVPQGLGLYADLTVDENLAFVAAAFGTRPAVLEGDLADERHRLVRELPLGLQRRLAVAQALSHGPELLILDEPTSGVGPLGRAELWTAVRGEAGRGVGVIVTTHHMEEAAQCDRLVIISAGRVAAQGTVAGIVGSATAVEVRAPHWAEAFDALERDGFAVGLHGTRLRVVATTSMAVRQSLDGAGVDAALAVVPATLEEVFVTLAAGGRIPAAV